MDRSGSTWSSSDGRSDAAGTRAPHCDGHGGDARRNRCILHEPRSRRGNRRPRRGSTERHPRPHPSRGSAVRALSFFFRASELVPLHGCRNDFPVAGEYIRLLCSVSVQTSLAPPSGITAGSRTDRSGAAVRGMGSSGWCSASNRPSPHRSAVSTESVRRVRIPSPITKRSTTNSIVCV